ncbi:Uncharacterised protein [Mycobacteroides abscessus subsp. abscessus]|nr:Uncharacterised protein [Mycobacteroides abscessus subsp. abscessus]
MSVGVGGQDNLRTGFQDVVTHQQWVTHHDERPVPGLAEGVRTCAYTDENRLVLLDERLEVFQIVRGTHTIGYDDYVAIAQIDVHVRNADAVDEQRTLTADELDGVPGEGFQVGHQAGFGFGHQIVHVGVGARSAGDEPAVTVVDAAVVHPDRGAVLDLFEDLGADAVDQGDAVGDQHLRPQIRVAARDRG